MSSSRVLPLTREWIEIPSVIGSITVSPVLPLTREWIEMIMKIMPVILALTGSPSYEGVD